MSHNWYAMFSGSRAATCQRLRGYTGMAMQAVEPLTQRINRS
jgi:hypothetical protein